MVETPVDGHDRGGLAKRPLKRASVVSGSGQEGLVFVDVPWSARWGRADPLGAATGSTGSRWGRIGFHSSMGDKVDSFRSPLHFRTSNFIQVG